MKWTQEELEELFLKANEKGLQDEAFAKRITENPKEALEELAGRELPEGFVLERIAGDGKHAAAYLKPNFAGGEIDLNELKSVTGGDGGFTPKVDCVEFEAKSHISIALIVSVCGAAAKVGPCPADVCGAAATCPGDVCGAATCGAEGGCVGHACAAEASGASAGCAGAVCAAAGCGADVGCAGHGCATDGCAANVGCSGDVCAAQGCASNVGCAGHGCATDLCAANVGCAGYGSAWDTCAANVDCAGYGSATGDGGGVVPIGGDGPLIGGGILPSGGDCLMYAGGIFDAGANCGDLLACMIDAPLD